ncbi:MAG: hypothetical protein WD696_07950 [Bryobacteraceae bacterium]
MRKKLVPLLREGTKESLEKAEELLLVLRSWDEEAGDERAEWERKNRRLQTAGQADEAMKAIRKRVSELRQAPLRAIRELDKRVLLLEREGLDLESGERRELRELRQSLFASLSLPERMIAKLYETWRAGVKEMYWKGDDGRSGGPDAG